jgi:hypothetical protein
MPVAHGTVVVRSHDFLRRCDMPIGCDASIGLSRWQDTEDEFLEVPGLTLRQARQRWAMRLAVDALLEDLFAATAAGRKGSNARTDRDRVVAFGPRERNRDA